MKLENTGVTSMDLDFEIPQPGISILQFMEGIEKHTNEKSGKTTLRLPMIIDQVVEGPESNHGCSMSHFVPIETPFGEKQLGHLLTMVGLVDAFAKKFGGEVDITGEKFINALKLKLPGKFIQVTHDVRVDPNGKDRVNITRMEAVGGKGKGGKTKPTAPPPPPTTEDEENW